MGQGRLYAITPGGTLKWVFGPIPVSEVSAQPIVAGDGKVYVGLGKAIYALDPDTGNPSTPPKQLWTYATTNYIQSSPLIGPVAGGRAVVYVPSRDHNLYAISGPRPGTITPTTCWSEGGPIGNHAPVANAGTDQSVTVSNPFTFDGAGSYDPDGDPLTVTWNFGDGVGGHGPCLASAQGCLNPTYTYATANSAGYTATLSVSDGQLSDSDTVKITVAASGGGGTPGSFFDNFNRADSDTLGSGWAEPPVSSLYAGNLVISGCGSSPCSSGKLKNAARGDNIGYLPALTGANQSASGDFIASDNNASPRLGVLLRFQDARNHYRLYRISGGSSQLRISKVVNGAESILKYVQVPMATVNTPFHLVGSVSGTGTGTTLTLTMGAVQISVTDATNPYPYASGNVGVLVNTGAAATHSADNFCAVIGGTCP
jgi:hypothetical protein